MPAKLLFSKETSGLVTIEAQHTEKLHFCTHIFEDSVVAVGFLKLHALRITRALLCILQRSSPFIPKLSERLPLLCRVKGLQCFRSDTTEFVLKE
jgi:hypothetical protein